MAKKVELTIGGQYNQSNRTCDSCKEKDQQEGVITAPGTIYLVASEEGKQNQYCSPCGISYLRNLEKYPVFNHEEYSNLHKTPEQRHTEQQEQSKTEEERKKEMLEKLNNR